MPQPTQVTNSRLPWIAIGVWALILALIVGTAMLFTGRDQSPVANSGIGANANPLIAIAPLADPSADPNASPGTQTKPEGPGKGALKKGLGLFGILGRGKGNGKGANPGNGGGAGPGRGPISIAAINGSQVSLKTEDGWTRTIDATGATIKRGDATIAVADLHVGDQVRFRQTRNADDTFKITEIVVVPAQAAGIVKSLAGNTVTLTLRDDTTKAITLTDATTYSLGKKAGTKADVKAGVQLAAQGTVGTDGTFTATKVVVMPAFAIGVVTGKTASTITIKSWNNTTITLNVTAATTYQARGKNPAALADVAVDNIVQAEGTLNPDKSLNATTVRIFPTGKGLAPFRAPGKGGNGNGKGGGNAKPNASPLASTTSG